MAVNKFIFKVDFSVVVILRMIFPKILNQAGSCHYLRYVASSLQIWTNQQEFTDLGNATVTTSYLNTTTYSWCLATKFYHEGINGIIYEEVFFFQSVVDFR